ncbi:MAG: hypothetical protein ABJB49_09095 [Nitrospirota bacterium]
MTHWIEADDFTLGAAVRVENVKFWNFEGSGSFQGSILWQVYSNSPSNTPGTLLFSGTSENLTHVATGFVYFGYFEFITTFDITPVTLPAGTYWLALHNGPLSNNTEAGRVYWETTSNVGTRPSYGLIAPFVGPWFGNDVPPGAPAECAFQLNGIPSTNCSVFSENFDSVAAPALPPGWVATNATGQAPLWVTSTLTPDTAPNDAFVDDPALISDKRLDTPGIFINSASARVSFRNSYDLEASIGNAVINGGFETGSLSPWVVDNVGPAPVVSNLQAHSGTLSGHVGSLPGGETPGDSSFYQTITVPAGGATLAYWYWPRTADTIAFDWQDAYVTDTSGTILATIMHVCQNSQAWTNVTFDMAPYAGQTVLIKFLAHGDNGSDPTDMFVDDVSLLVYHDGGVLEVSSPNINGGIFTDITNAAVGGSFVSGGYLGTLSTAFGNPIAGRMAWSGDSGGYITTVASLGANVVGQNVKLRFRMGSDNSAAATGWRIDSLSITGNGCSPVPLSAVSRKAHGGVGPFDINLPLTGTPGIECRSSGASNDYQAVVTFADPVTYTNASVTSGSGSVASAGGNGTTSVIVNLTGVTSGQTILVTISGVNDGTNTGDVTIPMSVLVGDTNGSRTVSSSDIGQTKAQSGQPVTVSNFREDVNVSGTINASDISLVKSRSGNFIP